MKNLFWLQKLFSFVSGQWTRLVSKANPVGQDNHDSDDEDDWKGHKLHVVQRTLMTTWELEWLMTQTRVTDPNASASRTGPASFPGIHFHPERAIIRGHSEANLASSKTKYDLSHFQEFSGSYQMTFRGTFWQRKILNANSIGQTHRINFSFSVHLVIPSYELFPLPSQDMITFPLPSWDMINFPLPSQDMITFPPSAKLRGAVRQCGHRPRGTAGN